MRGIGGGSECGRAGESGRWEEEEDVEVVQGGWCSQRGEYGRGGRVRKRW